MRFALYVEPPTAVHRLHPVTKLVGIASLYLAAFMVDDPRYLAPVGLIPISLLVAAGGTPLLRRFARAFVLIFVFTLVVWTIFYRGRAPSWEIGLSSAMRLGVFFVVGLLLLATTRVEEIAYGLGRLRVPYKAGFTLTLAFRLVPLFFDAAGTILDARAAAARLDEGGRRGSAASYRCSCRCSWARSAAAIGWRWRSSSAGSTPAGRGRLTCARGWAGRTSWRSPWWWRSRRPTSRSGGSAWVRSNAEEPRRRARPC
jgi:hypothetical protein